VSTASIPTVLWGCSVRLIIVLFDANTRQSIREYYVFEVAGMKSEQTEMVDLQLCDVSLV
jgi:hypothetical protein